MAEKLFSSLSGDLSLLLSQFLDLTDDFVLLLLLSSLPRLVGFMLQKHNFIVQLGLRVFHMLSEYTIVEFVHFLPFEAANDLVRPEVAFTGWRGLVLVFVLLAIVKRYLARVVLLLLAVVDMLT